MAHDVAVEHEEHVTHLPETTWDGAGSPFGTSYGKLMMWYFLLSDAFTFAGFLIAYGTMRFMMPTWPLPDAVFSTAPFGIHNAPLIFVTFMSFLLIISSVTMVRAVQEGHRENKNGVVFWLILTIIGGSGFLGCQAWEWTNLIAKEHMTIYNNPFSVHQEDGTFLVDEHGHSYAAGAQRETFKKGDPYLIHMHEGADSKKDYLRRQYVNEAGQTKQVEMGPKAFGALFFSITGFHGFHVFSGVVFLSIIAINSASGLYAKRRNGYEMVEKVGLYWHFVDLVWVFVFLVFYLL
jgi:cytochrome c oxidase subunit 3